MNVLNYICLACHLHFPRKVNLDFRKLGIHPSQLKFRIEELPVHGHLQMDVVQDGMLNKGQHRNITVGGEEKDQTFTMLDLWQGRVTYTHDGSEERNDSFTFSVFASNDKEVPGFLKGKELYRFDISISPVNDAPILSLPEGNIFTVIEKSKRQVSTTGCLQDASEYSVYIKNLNERSTMPTADNGVAKSVRP